VGYLDLSATFSHEPCEEDAKNQRIESEMMCARHGR